MIKLLVLGLLEERPMSGYDIQQKISQADAERWGGVLVGSIYHALKKLEQNGYIDLASIEKTGHRQKAVYKITDQGKDYLQSLITESLGEISINYPTTLYSGLSLLNRISNQEARQSLEKQKESLDEEYRILKEGQKRNEDSGEEISQLTKLTIDNMVSIIKQQQHFIEKILDSLEISND
ncbi:PadR family transcriptional regulator [Enterococcus sp. DIV0756]|uniref:PadR family transcriptional regulator n=1 Tax=Enterococcus sp. DIV0756 TaxID=2774636 RepID=UPI003F1EC0BE